MNRYQPSTPRVAFAVGAVAMTAITIAVSVVLPAKMGVDSGEPHMLAAAKATTTPSVAVEAGPTTVNVVAVRDPRLAAVPCMSSSAVASQKAKSADASERHCPHN